MKRIFHYMHGRDPAALSRWVSTVSRRVYAVWFGAMKILVESIQCHVSPVAGALFAILVLEGSTVFRAVWYTLAKYSRNPQVYGLNKLSQSNCHRRPVLLLPAAIGSWSYLGDLAVALVKVDIPVFVLNIELGLPTEETRKRIFRKIEEIRMLYYDFYQQLDYESDVSQANKESLCFVSEEAPTVRSLRTNQENDEVKYAKNSTKYSVIPLVDIVAHSNGGNLALFSAFTENCSYIDGRGNLRFLSVPQPNSKIGKIITVALPSNAKETTCMLQMNKLTDLFNVNAKFDALMTHKRCTLIEELPSHVEYIDSGHVGIVFNRSTHAQLIQFLLK